MERITEVDKLTNTPSIIGCGYENCMQTCEKHEHCFDCPIDGAIEKLKEYEDLEEQGKLVKLPCAVGDTAYYVDWINEPFDKVYEVTIEEIKINSEGVLVTSSRWRHLGEDFGKEIFLTKEEAEAELEKMRGKQGGD